MKIFIESVIGIVITLFLLMICAAIVYRVRVGSLWRTVSEQCVSGFLREGDPRPCLVLQPSSGYALLRAHDGPVHFLLVAQKRTLNSDERAMKSSGAPGYFRLAWQLRGVLSQELGRPIPDAAVSLALDAPDWFQQDQLNVSMACLRPDVMRLLQVIGHPLPDNSWITYRIHGHLFWFRALTHKEFMSENILRRISLEKPGGVVQLGRSGVALALLSDGRFLLAVQPGRWDKTEGSSGKATDLQDYSCKSANVVTHLGLTPSPH
ncbi:CDP-diacylglycerol diphosphatase [Xanthomonas euvesicatoria]|uniref:CDP-diacylglycerol diphosphatase n=1 Tax=Xanthomonas TaxID=338 RepID=UPI002456ABD9|nr:CDP-diacylglycerol diphosphatase [Xanthomonas euvesicatoria]MDH4910065.1 CDP-diacylglycerol diphosphatase [Xanthomonas euvesicatoria]